MARGEELPELPESALGAPPPRPMRNAVRERVLWVGFLICLAIGVVTVALPELSGADGDASHKRPQSAPAK
ncbi:MAG TPA: hypothetical protein VFZ61_01070 [Polyangiales bacterium]